MSHAAVSIVTMLCLSHVNSQDYTTTTHYRRLIGSHETLTDKGGRPIPKRKLDLLHQAFVDVNSRERFNLNRACWLVAPVAQCIIYEKWGIESDVIQIKQKSGIYHYLLRTTSKHVLDFQGHKSQSYVYDNVGIGGSWICETETPQLYGNHYYLMGGWMEEVCHLSDPTLHAMSQEAAPCGNCKRCKEGNDCFELQIRATICRIANHDPLTPCKYCKGTGKAGKTECTACKVELGMVEKPYTTGLQGAGEQWDSGRITATTVAKKWGDRYTEKMDKTDQKLLDVMKMVSDRFNALLQQEKDSEDKARAYRDLMGFSGESSEHSSD